MAHMTNDQLSITGVAIRQGIQCPVYVPTRKFYNASYFHDDRYRHEIANHYRDFKLRPRLRRRKRGLLQYTFHKPIVGPLREFPYEYLQELPMAVQELPRFDKTYTPRGVSKLCDEKRQDFICNDTLKRIQQARDDSATLKHLAQKQLERFGGFAPTNKAKRSIKAANVCQSLKKCDKWHNELIDLHRANTSNKYRRRSLGKLESVDCLTRQQQQQQQQYRRQPHQQARQLPNPFEHNCGVIRPIQSKGNFFTEQTFTGADKGRNSLTYYFQLASAYHEQGFLNNIKYLQNVGERNQFRRKRLQQLQKQQQLQQQRISNHSTSAHNIRNDCTSSPNEGTCNPILKIIAKKRSFRIYRYNDKERVHPTVYSAHWPIRVQIKPSDGSATILTTQISGTGNDDGNGYYKSTSHQTREDKRHTAKDCGSNSMNDYLYGNFQLQQLPQQTSSHFSHPLTSFHQSNPAKELLIDTLIGNLQELEISEHPINLPRITLSDYTHRYTTDNTNTQLPASFSLSGGKHCLKSILLRRQQSIELPSSNLDIPVASSDYQSEARPPQ